MPITSYFMSAPHVFYNQGLTYKCSLMNIDKLAHFSNYQMCAYLHVAYKRKLVHDWCFKYKWSIGSMFEKCVVIMGAVLY